MADENATKERKRYVAGNDAEYMSGVTRPTWDDPKDSPGLDKAVTKKYFLHDENGKPVLDEKGEPKSVSESLLALFGIFRQDWRLGNIDKDETNYINEHIDLSYDLLQSGCKDAALMCKERGISVIETSHSKKGFFRKWMSTLRNENYHEMREPQASFWKGGKNGGG